MRRKENFIRVGESVTKSLYMSFTHAICHHFTGNKNPIVTSFVVITLSLQINIISTGEKSNVKNEKLKIKPGHATLFILK